MVPSRPRLLAVVGAGLLCALAGPATTWANGDPASDVLIGSDVYLPGDVPSGQLDPRARSRRPTNPGVDPGQLRKARAKLDEALAEAKQDRFPVKVAVIATAADLGVVAGLFGAPQRYAEFLYTQIPEFRGNLLVVMPQGFGVEGPNTRTGVEALARRPVRGRDAAGLTRDAADAVPRLAEAAGRSSAGANTVAIVLVGGFVVLAAVAAVTLRLRARGDDGDA